MELDIWLLTSDSSVVVTLAQGLGSEMSHMKNGTVLMDVIGTAKVLFCTGLYQFR